MLANSCVTQWWPEGGDYIEAGDAETVGRSSALRGHTIRGIVVAFTAVVGEAVVSSDAWQRVLHAV